MSLESFDTLYSKMKANGGWKPGELITFAGRQSGKSTFQRQWLHPFLFEPTPPFEVVHHEKLRHDMVMCDVNQEIQDWLMKNFEPGKLWRYNAGMASEERPRVKFQRERVVMRADVYTALVLRWA
jgi:hypothetical protein